MHLQHYLVLTCMSAAISVDILCTPYNHAQVYCITSCKAIYNICMVHVCLTVTCHLHFWQNDQDLLRATAVTASCNCPHPHPLKHFYSAAGTPTWTRMGNLFSCNIISQFQHPHHRKSIPVEELVEACVLLVTDIIGRKEKHFFSCRSRNYPT